MRLMAEELYEEVFSVGGTIGGEHAYGLSRTQFLAAAGGAAVRSLAAGQADLRSGERAQSRARSSATIRN